MRTTLVLIGLFVGMAVFYEAYRPAPLPTADGKVQLDDWKVQLRQRRVNSREEFSAWLHVVSVKKNIPGNYGALPRKYPCTIVWAECRNGDEEASLVYTVTDQPEPQL
jgi:hypothetical protein